MSRDMIVVGSTMRIPLLYRGEYFEWRERFMNYIEEQIYGELLIWSITHGELPFLVISQVSLDGTAPNVPLFRLPYDIYSLINNNDAAKELWDALKSQIRGSKFGEQDRKAVVLEYEVVVAISDPLALVVEKTKAEEELSANMVFMAEMENVLFDSKESSSYKKDIIAEELCALGFLLASCQISSSELHAATYRGKENRIYILQSIDHGPFELGTTGNTLGTTPEGGVLLGPERPRTYDDLNDNENKRFDADVRATNIVLQGLPKDIYKLINHNIKAKVIWDNVKMLLAGSELTKEDIES
uniref:Integrase, catalytic region, zinc finger, CCHC-type, peptidase aspartic, catalytic n=1 Tax=Tanacetum cinerariifolium TaxID=118510 RepID=A0A6L2JEG4_TANCI|nr:integrase, catalytic region, zinc finger, CCHC-type, peptidase aspartic, catalytic [Tanacetum cinerariifolium]